MWPVLVAPVVLQGIAMAIDELWFHRRRRLPRWERIGHPLDTLTVVACYAWLLLVPCSPRAAAGYAALALLSCAFVTKDESVHARVCTSGEHHVHAVLFLLHPVVLASMALLWAAQRPGDAARGWLGDAGSARVALVVCAAATAAFGAAQAVYWNRPRSAPGEAARPEEPVAPAKPAVDNA
ncbi:MAG TPA: hypothetical protein VE987_22155, partial [Polyangiaceae bacterium]|nr:hypothetical protein [Polyangiaceae bacterium]